MQAGSPYVFNVGFRGSGSQTVVARASRQASRPCVGCTIRTGGTPAATPERFGIGIVLPLPAGLVLSRLRMSMDDTNALIKQRKEKLEALRAKGIDPFKNKFAPTEKCAEARANYVEGREVALAGRITAHRDMGKSQFIDIRDQSGRIQLYAQKQTLGDEQFEIFKHLDLGDFVGVRGTMFTTKTGEISVKLATFFILA